MNEQSCVDYQECFGTRGIVLCKSGDVKRVQDAGGVFSMRRTANRVVGGRKGYIYSSSCDLIHILRFAGQSTHNGPAFLLHNHQAPHE